MRRRKRDIINTFEIESEKQKHNGEADGETYNDINMDTLEDEEELDFNE